MDRHTRPHVGQFHLTQVTDFFSRCRRLHSIPASLPRSFKGELAAAHAPLFLTGGRNLFLEVTRRTPRHGGSIQETHGLEEGQPARRSHSTTTSAWRYPSGARCTAFLGGQRSVSRVQPLQVGALHLNTASASLRRRDRQQGRGRRSSSWQRLNHRIATSFFSWRFPPSRHSATSQQAAEFPTSYTREAPPPQSTGRSRPCGMCPNTPITYG